MRFVKQLLHLLSCEAPCISIHALLSGVLYSGRKKEKADGAAGFGLKSVLGGSAHVETDLFVKLNVADKIIECPAVWKRWERS